MTGFTASTFLSRNRVSLKEAFEGLELCEGKLSCTVLRGLDGSNPVRLLGLLAAPRADPDGRFLAHPVLISDNWRQSDPRDKDGVLAVEGAIGQPEREYVSRRSGVSDCGGEGCATTAR